jgi:hypothetical protein
MIGFPSALGGYPFEGAFVLPPIDRSNGPTWANPVPSVLAGPGALRAAPGGTIQGRFGWANPATGLVSNTRITAEDQIGIVKPYRSASGADVVGFGWTWQYFDPTITPLPFGGLVIRQGLNVNLIAAGPMWLRFVGGAYPGETVYASLTDGSAISGSAAGAEATRWVVSSNCSPGNLAIVSTTAFFT